VDVSFELGDISDVGDVPIQQRPSGRTSFGDPVSSRRSLSLAAAARFFEIAHSVEAAISAGTEVSACPRAVSR
jgi:hypothetical protein